MESRRTKPRLVRAWPHPALPILLTLPPACVPPRHQPPRHAHHSKTPVTPTSTPTPSPATTKASSAPTMAASTSVTWLRWRPPTEVSHPAPPSSAASSAPSSACSLLPLPLPSRRPPVSPSGSFPALFEQLAFISTHAPSTHVPLLRPPPTPPHPPAHPLAARMQAPPGRPSGARRSCLPACAS